VRERERFQISTLIMFSFFQCIHIRISQFSTVDCKHTVKILSFGTRVPGDPGWQRSVGCSIVQCGVVCYNVLERVAVCCRETLASNARCGAV